MHWPSADEKNEKNTKNTHNNDNNEIVVAITANDLPMLLWPMNDCPAFNYD